MSDHQPPAFVPSPEYLARQKRLDDAMNLRKPDRVPVAPLVVHFYATRSLGILNKDAMYDHDCLHNAWKQAAVRHNWDVAAPVGPVFDARQWDFLGLNQVRWPGQSLTENMPFQWVEDQYMLADEYDEMLADPSGFTVRKIWPRISKTLTPLSTLYSQLPYMPLLQMSNAYMVNGLLLNMFGTPEMTDALHALLEQNEQMIRNSIQAATYRMQMAQLGFPTLWTSITMTAFDWISDTLRGLRGIMLDMYRCPDKLQAIIDMFVPVTIQAAVTLAQMSGVKGVFIPMHRGAGGFMSNEQYAKFYWPNLKALILGIIDAGLLPIPLLEGNYTPRLEFFQELPAKKWVAHFDIVDRKRAKQLLGDNTCFWGNVPAGTLCTGTPEQVTADVCELIDIFGDNGGLIIDSTMGIPDESKPENVQALTDAVMKYGVY